MTRTRLKQFVPVELVVPFAAAALWVIAPGQLGLLTQIATTAIVNGAEADLRRKAARLVAESAAVHVGQLDPGIRVLNLDTEISED